MSKFPIDEPVAVLAVLLGVLAGLFFVASRPAGARFFRFVPLLIFAYFVPTLFSNIGFIPLQSRAYDFITTWLLPASLLLLTMSVDIRAISKLGRNVLVLFFAGTLSIMVGGPLALLFFGRMIPPDALEPAWKGLAALSGSWIGGTANFVAIGKSVGASDSMLGTMVVIDVALANAWMAVLLLFASNERKMDKALGADRSTLDEVRDSIATFQKEVARETSLADLFAILFLALGSTVVAKFFAGHVAAAIANHAPEKISELLSPFAWTVILVTGFGVAFSFTRIRNLEGAGAGRIGSMFLYLLVASIGAKAEFSKVFDTPALLLVCSFWIAFHAITLLVLRRFIRAPVFFLAVGSQANIGGAASAPIVAGAFHPALAPVGALMGVLGYVVGTYAGLGCAFLMRVVYELF